MPTATTDPGRTVISTESWLPGYETHEIIGSGGCGTVYRARQLAVGRDVAVKVIELDRELNPGLAARFQTEATSLGQFSHPNIVQVYDCGWQGRRAFIVMELLHGEDLGRRLQRGGRLPEPVVWSIIRQTAAGLAHAASRGVVHRDVKPENLFLVPAPDGIGLPPDVPLVKVTDFGLARAKWDGEADVRLTAHGTVLGTPLYMAPEQYERAPDVDHRADIYALGATAYHAIEGKPPFGGRTMWDVIARKRQGPPSFGSGVSRESAALIAAMMAPNPAHRVGSYGELLARINRLSGVPGAVRWRPRWSGWGWLGRQRWRLLAGCGLVALAVGGVWAGSQPGPGKKGNPSGEPTPRYVSDGYQQSLVGGKGASVWLPNASGGAWAFEPDEQGVTVLAGRGFVLRPFAPVENYRVTIGLDLHRANVAEIHFALPAKGSITAPRLVLRATRAEGAVLGTMEGDKGHLQPIGQPVPFPPKERFEGRVPYVEARFARTGGVWRAWFDGLEVGSLPDDGTPKAGELRLFAGVGRARVESVVLEQLQPQPH